MENKEEKNSLKSYLETSVKDLLIAVADTVNKGKELVVREAPDIAKEIIVFQRWDYSSRVVGELILISFLSIIFYKIGNWSYIHSQEVNNNPFPIFGFFTCLFGGLCIIMTGIDLLCNFNKCLKTWLMPKISLLEYIRNYLK